MLPMDRQSLWDLIRREHSSLAGVLVASKAQREPFVVIEGHSEETDAWILSALRVGNRELFDQVTGPMQAQKKELFLFSPSISIDVPTLIEALLTFENSKDAVNDAGPEREAV